MGVQGAFMTHLKEIDIAPIRTTEQSDAVVRAASRASDAFVELFCQYNVRGNVLVDILRHSILRYAVKQMEQSEDESVKRSRKVSLTRLIMTTGLDGRTIKNFLNSPPAATEGDLCPEAAILGSWAKDPALRDPVTGKPKDLSIYGPTGTLEGLVQRHAGRGVSVMYVLDRLIKNGNVKQLDKLYVRLVSPDWKLFERGEDDFLSCATEAIVGLCNTIGHNLKHIDCPEKKWVERQAFSYMIPEELRAEAEKEFNELLIKQWHEAKALVRKFESQSEGLDTPTESIGMRYFYTRFDQANIDKSHQEASDVINIKKITGPWRDDC